MRFITQAVIAPLVFFFAYRAFRSPILKRSKRKHLIVMKLFRFCADHGHRKALSVYGHLLHFRGEGAQNRIQGGIYLQQAAEKGDEKAQYQMAKIYEEGYEHYFQPDNGKALHYYQLAAEQGHPLAIRRLIKIYQNAELGQSVNPALLEKWQAVQPDLESL